MSAPRAPTLIPLFLAAALEKLGTNGVRAMLVLYLVKGRGLSGSAAFGVFGATMAASFLTPLLGGFLADRFLGAAVTALVGAVLAFLGLALLALPQGVAPLYPALALSVLGSGFLKSLLPSLLGQAAGPEAARKDSLFSTLYLAFNVGSLLGTLGCAALGELVGWRTGFTVAAAAMLACVGCCFRYVAGEPRGTPVDGAGGRGFAAAGWMAAAGLLLCGFLPAPRAFGPVLGVSFVATFMVMFFLSIREEGRTGARRMFELLALMGFHTLFFALYEQAGLSLTLFTETGVDRSLGRLIPGLDRLKWGDGVIDQIPVTLFQSIDPLLNVALGGFFVVLWLKLERRGANPGPWAKFAAGLGLTSLSFFLLRGAILSRTGLISPWELIGTYELFVLAEQLIVPTGFSAVARLAPPRFGGFFMGGWFLSIAVSEWLAAMLSQGFPPVPGCSSGVGACVDYGAGFSRLAAIAGVGAFLLAAGGVLARLGISATSFGYEKSRTAQ